MSRDRSCALLKILLFISSLLLASNRTTDKFYLKLFQQNQMIVASLKKQYGGLFRTSLGKFQHFKEWTRPELGYACSCSGSFNVAPTPRSRTSRLILSHISA
eukprot:scaffold110730_cov59-Attheya_sp.AAC.6